MIGVGDSCAELANIYKISKNKYKYIIRKRVGYYYKGYKLLPSVLSNT